jgi:hypothetical protein
MVSYEGSRTNGQRGRERERERERRVREDVEAFTLLNFGEF